MNVFNTIGTVELEQLRTLAVPRFTVHGVRLKSYILRRPRMISVASMASTASYYQNTY